MAYMGKCNGVLALRPDNGAVYSGETKDGWPHGQGKYTLPCGDVYVGRFKKGMRDGYGKVSYANGAMYDGQWRKDRKHGHGKFSQSNGNVYEGQLKQDMRHGHGKYTQTVCDQVSERWVYEGEFKDNMMHGRGRIEFADGYACEGPWKNDVRHGQMRCVYPDGLVCAKEFNEGTPVGPGPGQPLDGWRLEGSLTLSEDGYWKFNGLKLGKQSISYNFVMETVAEFMAEDKVNKVAQEKQRANTRARWRRCTRAVLKQLREDKAATTRNAAESARQKAVRDTVKRNRTATAMREAAQRSTTLPGQGHEPHRVPHEAPDAVASAVRQTEKEANLVRLNEQTAARRAKEAENRARLAEQEANIRIGFQINEQE